MTNTNAGSPNADVGDEAGTDEIFADLPHIDEETLARLHDRLVRQAERDGTLDIGYRTIETPVGLLLLAATDKGLIRIAYDSEGHDLVLAKLATLVSPQILEGGSRLEEPARQIAEYFAGTRTTFDVPLDFRLAKGFRLDVLSHLQQIAYGHTESYAQVAQAAGSPRAVRAVGTACATNPLPVVVPCHRVVRSDGSFGGYVGGLEAKAMLLTMEAAA